MCDESSSVSSLEGVAVIQAVVGIVWKQGGSKDSEEMKSHSGCIWNIELGGFMMCWLWDVSRRKELRIAHLAAGVSIL